MVVLGCCLACNSFALAARIRSSQVWEGVFVVVVVAAAVAGYCRLDSESMVPESTFQCDLLYSSWGTTKPHLGRR